MDVTMISHQNVFFCRDCNQWILTSSYTYGLVKSTCTIAPSCVRLSDFSFFMLTPPPYNSEKKSLPTPFFHRLPLKSKPTRKEVCKAISGYRGESNRGF
ncbi:uncharacterized protein LOC143222754 isoform X2 [Tachypleus tridentatus]|uniref:uncharacterized protein LOC143222754 isoform X2 n=1 Tax=Tachypleus tridentatus TaxID=6853 RepID=UPI003FD427F7